MGVHCVTLTPMAWMRLRRQGLTPTVLKRNCKDRWGYKYQVCSRVGSKLAGQVGSGLVRVTRWPDPTRESLKTSSPGPTRPDPTRPGPIVMIPLRALIYTCSNRSFSFESGSMCRYNSEVAYHCCAVIYIYIYIYAQEVTERGQQEK